MCVDVAESENSNQKSKSKSKKNIFFRFQSKQYKEDTQAIAFDLTPPPSISHGNVRPPRVCTVCSQGPPIKNPLFDPLQPCKRAVAS